MAAARLQITPDQAAPKQTSEASAQGQRHCSANWRDHGQGWAGRAERMAGSGSCLKHGERPGWAQADHSTARHERRRSTHKRQAHGMPDSRSVRRSMVQTIQRSTARSIASSSTRPAHDSLATSRRSGGRDGYRRSRERPWPSSPRRPRSPGRPRPTLAADLHRRGGSCRRRPRPRSPLLCLWYAESRRKTKGIHKLYDVIARVQLGVKAI